MDNVNVRMPPTQYETNSAGWYISTAFVEPPTQSTPVLCTLASDQPHFGSDSQHISSDDQHYEVIPENTGICQFVWDHLNDVNCALQRVKKARGTFSGWKMDVCIPEVVAVGHHCTYEGCYPEDWKVQKILVGLTAILSPRSMDSWEYVVSYGSGSRISPSVQGPS